MLVAAPWVLAAPVAAPGRPQPAAAQATAADPFQAGLALREGVRALREGDAERAAALLSATARHHALVADHATRLRIQALLEAGRPDDAIAVGGVFERDHADSPLQGAVLGLLGRAFAQVGDEESARKAWEAALELTSGGHERGELWRELALSHERSGKREAAVALYRKLWRQRPLDAEDAATGEALDRLQAARGRPARSAEDWLERADALYEARRNEAALAAYDAALALGLPAAKARAARRQRAFSLFRQRRYPEATQAFAALGGSAENRFWLARCYARQGSITRSIDAFEKLGRGRSSFARQARFLAATLLEGEGETARARAHYAELAGGRGPARTRAAARWRLGWSAYREGRFAAAVEQLDQLARLEADPLVRLRARYWAIRAREGRQEQGTAERFAELAREYPLTYYGWRAALRAGDRLGEREPPLPEAVESHSLEARRLQRLQALLTAELAEAARSEIRSLARSARGLGDRLEIARLYTDAGEYHRAQRAVLDVYLERLARGPEPGREELWWFAWPRAFHAPLSAALVDGVDAELVLAVMREESGYRPSVVSPVGARGLMQIMPETGRRLAADLAVDGFDAEQLFEPDTNLRLGAFYLEELLRRFDGRRSAAVASYNAGPGAVTRWLRERPGLADDEWVEAIPYDQTRRYVKRVLRSVHAYRVLY